MLRKIKLTPYQAWKMYGDDFSIEKPVEFLLSDYIVEGVTDIPTICFKEAEIVLNVKYNIVSVKDIEYIAHLFEEYIMDYINKKGGIDKLKLYTKEEILDINEQQAEDFCKELDIKRKKRKE